MQIAFAEDDRTGREQFFDNRRVAFGPMAFEAGGAARSRQIGGIEIIFQSERHAVQRTKRGAGRTLLIRLPCGLANLIGFKRYECRKTGVSGGSRQQRVGKFFGSRPARADGRGGCGYAKIVQC